MRYILSAFLLAAVSVSCAEKPEPEQEQEVFVPNTVQEEFEHVAVDAVRVWGESGSAVILDAFANLLAQELSRKGIPDYPGGEYMITNSKDADVDVSLTRSRQLSRMVMIYDGVRYQLPVETKVRVKINSNIFGYAILSVSEADGKGGCTVSLRTDSTDQSTGSVELELVPSSGGKFEIASMDMSAGLVKEGVVFSLHDNDGCETCFGKKAVARLSGGSLVNFGRDFSDLRSFASLPEKEMEKHIASFNARYQISLFLEGVGIGRSEACFFSDETGDDIDIVLHFDSDNVSSSIPKPVFDYIDSIPEFEEA